MGTKRGFLSPWRWQKGFMLSSKVAWKRWLGDSAGREASPCPRGGGTQGNFGVSKSAPPPPPAPGTHCARREARQPYMDGVYMLPLREERSREGLVFWLKISWLAAWKAFSTSLLV